jgi:hypothetical protein
LIIKELLKPILLQKYEALCGRLSKEHCNGAVSIAGFKFFKPGDVGLFFFLGSFLKDCCFFNRFCGSKPLIKKLIGAEGARSSKMLSHFLRAVIIQGSLFKVLREQRDR